MDTHPPPSPIFKRAVSLAFNGREHRPLWAILLVAMGLRVLLALQGGQYYFGDETRYGRGALIYLGAWQGNSAHVREALSSPEHAGFTYLAALLTPLQHLLSRLAGGGSWAEPENFYAAAPHAAILLGLFSVANIWLVHRLARALTIFVCLLGGYALARLAELRPRWRMAAVGSVAAIAAVNFAPHFLLVFPNDVKTKIWREIGMPKHAFSFDGANDWRPTRPVTRPDLALINTGGLTPLGDYVGEPPGEVIFSVQHPVQLGVYQYEGFSRRDRELIREHRPAMKLIRLAKPQNVPDFPSPI